MADLLIFKRPTVLSLFASLFLIMSVLRYATLNINGEQDMDKCLMIHNIKTNYNIDVLFLQEAHSTSSDII